MKHISFILLFFVLLSSCKSDNKNALTLENTTLSGPVFGTSFSIIYNSEVNYMTQVDSLFEVINRSMSTYIPNSDISKLNRGEDVTVDEHFVRVFESSKVIYRATEGAFDPTIGAVVNAWDFGPEGKVTNVDSTAIDSLMKSVGFNRMGLKDQKIIKNNASFLDFNAIAKGYSVDVVAEFLENKNIDNYLVEIGGEIRAKGINVEKNQEWKVGLDEPRFDGEQSVLKAITLKDQAMATSGTYRKFKMDSAGNRYAHIIDTKTGYPSKTNILSVSVIAEDCMTADGYATAFQAMGIDKIKRFVASRPELKVFIVYENEQNEFDTEALNSFPE
ncbi:FAD:protein FMN transferase [Psychroserpens sp.]|uniref:FAD:protein FMN transferase n=1 Tax=Psychroserpens sp. TaxID=2020870 RepID=UPI003C730E87